MNIKEKIKITDLAKKIGVSVSSVSRALNNHHNISKKTKEKITKAAQKYNYFPNLNAKRLASKKPDTIAFLTSLDPYAQDYVLMEFLAGLTNAIKDQSTELIVKFFSDEKTELNYYKKLVELNIADKFVFYRTKQKDKRIKFLKKNNINFVSWGRTTAVKNYAWIDLDNEKSIFILMNRLLNFGHRNIGLINIHQSFNYGNQRKIAFEKFHKIKNMKFDERNYLDSIDSSSLSGINLTKRLLTKRNPPTAIICSTDKFFMGCIQECQKRNLQIGKDISIVGYNDQNNFLSSQNLTYISHPLTKMGEISVQMLKDIENGVMPGNISKLIEPILNVGKSDGKKNS